ncbi:hypothetical protein CIB84_004475 [Bambusicola thoracicus]|uniref:Uncharacterized protein n=1 Tax=Bambusicola thoracicus TaxID=9083 RepID=A0A2P4T5Z6_BAMTH|nr:hypothetical protein CIB84_004475 [Bambusicola thoracicus]
MRWGALWAGHGETFLSLGSGVPFMEVRIAGYSWDEKMFGFHKPKMYRSIEGCCICRAKSSSSRFTDSKRYEKDFQNCFGLNKQGDIFQAAHKSVWFNQVVDARAGPSLKTTLKPKKMKTLSGSRIKSNQISKLQKEFKRHNSDAHSTTSSASPAQSPCYSNQSDEGSDTEMSAGSSRTPVFSFLDLTYWKRGLLSDSSPASSKASGGNGIQSKVLTACGNIRLRIQLRHWKKRAFLC